MRGNNMSPEQGVFKGKPIVPPKEIEIDQGRQPPKKALQHTEPCTGLPLDGLVVGKGFVSVTVFNRDGSTTPMDVHESKVK
jgi:hypothetical protein